MIERRNSWRYPREEMNPTVSIKRRISYKIPIEIKKNSDLRKYWLQRFSLFSRFDDGIKLDEESWYSVTPEFIARKTAERLKTNVIIDGFCGAGGNAIQFAFTCNKVIAIDIDPKKIELARNNAAVYGVLHKIEFMVGDFIQLASEIEGDAVFLSPPWGGPSYINEKSYDLENMLQPVPFSELVEVSKKISPNIAVFLPRNSNTFDMEKYAGKNGLVKIEKNFMDKRLVGVTVYFNDIVKKMETTGT
ncbi:trimethylguanosine synthase-like [Harmonia axyridis]|uniref:trimethylguanosine synthase-like n=1 Tax=Harmonia axyridis TaxID=115357 RepID=UPI001E27943A|nr:trimethylguanosine synthase-like [Harmonia axyridis]XP_045479974.1 trimethylguanosine synthase-like [Harmonia axyridis]